MENARCLCAGVRQANAFALILSITLLIPRVCPAPMRQTAALCRNSEARGQLVAADGSQRVLTRWAPMTNGPKAGPKGIERIAKAWDGQEHGHKADLLKKPSKTK